MQLPWRRCKGGRWDLVTKAAMDLAAMPLDGVLAVLLLWYLLKQIFKVSYRWDLPM